MSTQQIVSSALVVLFLNAGSVSAEQSTFDQAQWGQVQFRQSASESRDQRPYLTKLLRSAQLPVYLDYGSGANHFFPTGFMGDYSDVFYNGAYRKNPHSGTTCVKVVYQNRASQGARWAGMYWQNPAYNWGNLENGRIHLTGASKLVFWARGEKGNETIEAFKVGGITGRYGDSSESAIGPVVLSRDWRKYEIDLRSKDLSAISGGFAWTMTHRDNPNGAVFYLDDIYFI